MSEAQPDPIPGKIISQADTPRSYLVDSPTGPLRRNSQHLIPRPTDIADNNTSQILFHQEDKDTVESPHIDPPRRIITRSQTGIRINPPDRWN